MAYVLSQVAVERIRSGKVRCRLCGAVISVSDDRGVRAQTLYSAIYRHFKYAHPDVLDMLRSAGSAVEAELMLRRYLSGESTRQSLSYLMSRFRKLVEFLCGEHYCTEQMLREVMLTYVNSIQRDLRMCQDVSPEDVLKLVSEGVASLVQSGKLEAVSPGMYRLRMS